MKRREFLKAAGTGLAASTAVAAPAIAQSMPELKWRMTTSFPKSLDTLHGGAEVFAKAIREATDNKFQISVFAAGEIVPAPQRGQHVAHALGLALGVLDVDVDAKLLAVRTCHREPPSLRTGVRMRNRCGER